MRRVDGQYELHFEGPWAQVTMWEVPALAISLLALGVLTRDGLWVLVELPTAVVSAVVVVSGVAFAMVKVVVYFVTHRLR